MAYSNRVKQHVLPDRRAPPFSALTDILHWDDLDSLFQHIATSVRSEWYLYDIDKSLPKSTVTQKELDTFTKSMIKYLREAHAKNYCGLVYVDSPAEPTLIRIFDPALVLSMCNINGNVTTPSWIISKMDPTQLAIRDDAFSSRPITQTPSEANQTLDARHMGCPLPLIHTCRALKKLVNGEVLEVITKEPGAINDIESICHWTGDQHVALEEGGDGYSFFVQRKR